MDTHPGFATDLLFDRYQGEVSAHPHFWAVRTPTAPDYYFGNYLLLSAAPSDRDKGWLEQSFDKLIATDPRVRHRTFQWPLAEGQNSRVAGFVATGYQYMECVVLTLERAQLLTPPDSAGAHIRPFTATDWADWLALELEEREPDYPAESYLAYLESRQRLYQTMTDDGLGNWWGLWQGDQLAASCGLFFTATLGRFQLVRTRQAWRNRGLCKLLLARVAEQGLIRVPQLVIVADEQYHAQRVYRDLGFIPTARIASLCRWPREEEAP
ncbi:ribosomal protein S18 acetylase RimI-like enzyme [Aeromonas sp. BIGb0405]|jgi:ribosomal protein S18 acetylase RimI-like enzyme|uniref:GNAT family N-acetyltransferase n=1 Tax=Aeromonas sp. BIGb0405 TaxID=2940592 RepID=UPI00216A8049|nr:GNAT family N-acetyltransferase [Aeromonas sp. BIGb0405]MCS3457353.1 ribosomal protein S18 acetylase RimI-like enzyme [Aeromonas sp. BIGb0405]